MVITILITLMVIPIIITLNANRKTNINTHKPSSPAVLSKGHRRRPSLWDLSHWNKPKLEREGKAHISSQTGVQKQSPAISCTFAKYWTLQGIVNAAIRRLFTNVLSQVPLANLATLLMTANIVGKRAIVYDGAWQITVNMVYILPLNNVSAPGVVLGT